MDGRETCPRCGRKLKPEWKHCPSCFLDLLDEEQQPDDRQAQLETALRDQYPRLKQTKGSVPVAVYSLARLFEFGETPETLILCRLATGEWRGTGIAAVTDRGMLHVDAHPGRDPFTTVILWRDLASATAAATSGPVWTYSLVTDNQVVQLLMPDPARLTEAIERFAPVALTRTPSEAVAEWWQDPTIVWPPPITPGAWEYIGGIATLPRPISGLALLCSADGIAAKKGAFGPPMFVLPWNEIGGVAVEGSIQVQQRVTVTRLLAVGIFAFAWQAIELCLSRRRDGGWERGDLRNAEAH
ncbi:MAG: zinc ribbon domain-containing protein [Chloroflexi bacterium]|nr:zinc ribbon domain-containing protein [Chloroflexota bacterium]